MILKHLHLNDYKILKNFNLDFTKQIGVIIGINGSGKSSILEALSLMFSIAYSQIILKRKTEVPKNICNSSIIFELRYKDDKNPFLKSEIEYVPVKLLINDSGKVEIFIHANSDISPEHYIYLKKKYLPEDLLPNRLILYYSGMSTHLKNIHLKNEDNILKQFTQNPEQSDTGYIDRPKIPTYLFESSDYGLLFAGLLGYAYNDRVKNLIENKLHIHPNKDQEYIKLIIKKIEFDRLEHRANLKELEENIILFEDNDPYFDPMSFRYKEEKVLMERRISTFFGASGRLGMFLKQLLELHKYPDRLYDEMTEEYTLIFDAENWKYLAEEVYQDPKILFENLLMLKYNNLLDEIDINVLKDELSVNIDKLSEGEKQIVIITALNEILGTTNSLFLFDEPDNYLHPSLQDDLIRNIESNNLVNELMQNQYLITTHNPSFLNNLNPDQGELFIIKKGLNIPHHYSWFGRDINDTISEIMGSEFRPNWAIEEIQSVDSLLDKGDLETAEKRFKILKSKLSGNDTDIVRLQTKLDFLKD